MGGREGQVRGDPKVVEGLRPQAGAVEDHRNLQNRK